jgi:hypothetical protein
MNTTYLAQAGFSVTSADGMDAITCRWGVHQRPDVYRCTTSKDAMDDGKAAKLERRFEAVPDDFGTLVEVST